MNYGILGLTFISVNLDFFFMLLFLLKKYRLPQVMLGYLLGNLVLLSASYFIGQALAVFLPEWLLGILGLLPIYLAFHDDDDDDGAKQLSSPVLNVFLTYLSVCAGCNLAIFLPVLVGQSFNNFLITLIFIGSLSLLAVWLIHLLADLPAIAAFIEAHGDKLMKICYIVIGFYVFWDSGLIHHILGFF